MDVGNIIKDANSHIPVSRKTILEHIESKDMGYRTKDGQICSIDPDELQYLAENCTEIEKMRLRIPVFVSTDTSSSSGAWKIEGRTEVAVISRILGKKVHTDDFLRLYHPDYVELKKRLSSIIFVVFTP